MFLRNYDNYIAAFNCISSLTSRFSGEALDINFGDNYISQKSTSGAVTSYCYFCDGSDYIKPPLFMACPGICLGDGNEAVTYDDYKLSGNTITNNLAQVSRKRGYNSETGKHTVTLVATYNNSGDTDITISEWGLWRSNTQNYSISTTSFSNSSSTCVLVYREVLDEPIVIEAGTTATLTFSIDIPMPNHP